MHQCRNQADLGAALVQERDQAVDVICRLRQRRNVVGCDDLDADEIRVIRHKAEQIQRLQNADNAFAIDAAIAVHFGDHHPVYPFLDHDGKRIAKLVRRSHRNQRKIGE